MAYTEPTTRATLDVLHDTDWNAEIVDNFITSIPDIFTTKGDIGVGTGSKAMGRLGVGANGTSLTPAAAETTGMKWAAFAPVWCAAKRASNQPLGVDSLNIVNFDDIISDTGSYITTGAAWKFTPPADGIYLIALHLEFADGTDTTAWREIGDTTSGYSSYASLSLYKNGSEYRSVGWFAPQKNDSTTLNPAVFSNVFPIDLDDTDYIDFRTYVHYTGDTYAILATSTDTGKSVTTRVEIACLG
jgi:hypothetical protein